MVTRGCHGLSARFWTFLRARKKHDAVYPAHAIACGQDEAGIAPAAVDRVVFYDKPFLTFERRAVPMRCSAGR